MKILSVDFSYFIHYKNNAKFLEGCNVPLGQNISTIVWADKIKDLNQSDKKRVIEDIYIDYKSVYYLMEFLTSRAGAYFVDSQKDSTKIALDNISFNNKNYIHSLSSYEGREKVIVDEYGNISINDSNWLNYFERYMNFESKWIQDRDIKSILADHYDIIVVSKSESKVPPVFDNIYESIKSSARNANHNYSIGSYSRERDFNDIVNL